MRPRRPHWAYRARELRIGPASRIASSDVHHDLLLMNRNRRSRRPGESRGPDVQRTWIPAPVYTRACLRWNYDNFSMQTRSLIARQRFIYARWLSEDEAIGSIGVAPFDSAQGANEYRADTRLHHPSL
jgi:hypothetical protein